MLKTGIKKTLQLCSMFDDYIRERTKALSMLYTEMLPKASSKDEEIAILMQIGYLKRDLGFARASAFGFVHNVQSRDPEFGFWLKGVI